MRMRGRQRHGGSVCSALFLRIICTRRFWFVLLATVYGALACSTWNTVRTTLYASMLFGTASELLTMVAMLSITLPAMQLTRITILAFVGKLRDLNRSVTKWNDVWRCDYLTVYTHKLMSHSQGFMIRFR
ncbi:hypothetical protein SUGI_0285830 [Cryptomeria japonica]|nr:hypothetical protein SUGI_0285830 [Cryptomeria japonica]